MKKETTLVIVFNQFYEKNGVQYIEVVYDPETMSTEERALSRPPRAARFDRVMETGEGSYNQWNAHKAKRLHDHRLEKK